MCDTEFDDFISRTFFCCYSVMKDVACIYVAHPDSKSAPKITFETHFARWFHKAATIIRLKQSAGMAVSVEQATAIAGLRLKYEQYRSMAIERNPLIKIVPNRVRLWSAVPL